MSQLTADRNTIETRGELLIVPVKANAKLFAGGMAAADASGFAIPGAKAASLTTLGRIETSVDNTGGADGAVTVTVKRGTFKFENDATNPVTAAHIKKDCYFIDDQTVTSLSTGSSKAGVVLGIAQDGQIIVDIR